MSLITHNPFVVRDALGGSDIAGNKMANYTMTDVGFYASGASPRCGSGSRAPALTAAFATSSSALNPAGSPERVTASRT